MKPSRRGFLGALLAPFASRYLPKRITRIAPHTAEPVGLSIRFIRQYDVRSSQVINRLDVLSGWPLERKIRLIDPDGSRRAVTINEGL